MIRHVPRVATLLIVEGALECVPGLILTGFGAAVAFGIVAKRAPMEEIPGGPAFVLFVLGPLLLVAGILKIVAGVRNRRQEGYTLGLVALVSGLVAVPTCYCAPTAFALLVYGLIVYLDNEVRAAFAARVP